MNPTTNTNAVNHQISSARPIAFNLASSQSLRFKEIRRRQGHAVQGGAFEKKVLAS